MKTIFIKAWNENTGKISIVVLVILMFLNLSVQADDIGWPKIINVAQGEITVYQPQPETLDGTTLAGRAAVSVKHKDAKRPTFGAIWITSTIEVDRDTRIAVLKNIKIPNIRFSDEIDSANVVKISNLIEEEMPKWNLEISMDDLITTLESTTVTSGKNFKHDAPEIIVSYKPSILVFIDGEPILKKMDDYNFRRIENTPFFIIFDDKKNEYYIYSETYWVTSKDLNGKWEKLTKESSSLKKLREEILKANPPEDQATTSEGDNIPEVIVRTTQSELIVFDGEPSFKPIETTNLLYVENTENDVFMDIQSQNYFILVSGRWYSAKAMDGPWNYTESDKLPVDFAKIPRGSDKDVVLASVAGTDEARDAILDAQIPETAEVNRKTTTIQVEYDGEPKFEKVDGTSMLYAVNSPQTVLKVGDKFYCVDNGIWFVALTAKGIWAVSDTRPEEVENIEPSSSVYNVKYVYIYDSTPDIVYVGYTPGYFGSYVYGPTVIYGTGYRYHPWYGIYYYPRPVTYGFSMHYNPWTGWGIGFGFGYGPVHIHWGGYHGYYGGYWGCPAYRPPYYHRPPYHGGGYYGPGRNPGYGGGNRPGSGNRPGTGGRPSTLPSTRPANNIYGNNRAGVKPNISTRPAAATSDVNRGNKASQRPANNVYTDKSGNVYKKTDKGWERRDGNNWKNADKSPSRSDKAESRPSTRPGNVNPSTRPNTGNSNIGRPSTRPANSGAATQPATQPVFNRNELNRQANDRNRGATRTNNFNNFSGSSRGTGGAMPAQRGGSGGGARRR